MNTTNRAAEHNKPDQIDRGRSADTPAHIPLAGWLDIARRMLVFVSQHRIPLIAAGVTYFLLLSLVPLLTLFVTLYSLFTTPVGIVDHLGLLTGLMPPGGVEILTDQLQRLTSQDDSALSLTLVVSFIVALWTASAGIKALFEAMNLVYNESERRGFIKTNLLAFLFLLVSLAGATIALFAVLVVPVVLSLVPLAGQWEWLVRITSYLIMFVVVLTGLSSIYRWGPNRAHARWHWITPGSVFATLLIVLISVLFSWYASNFSTYNATYGSLGALIGMLTWMWLTVIAVIMGGLLNSEVEHQTTRDTTTGRPRPMGQRGAYVADTVGRKWGGPD